MKLHIKKGDKVTVLSGDSKGQIGEVREIDTKKMRAIVIGVNMISKHAKASTKYPQGGIIKMEGPVHISNLMLIEPKTGKPTRTGRKADANGKMVRFSKKSGEIIK
ncbi:MAG TPA: 50S ribosomal protein L24 [Flavobacteriales bacterium]|jgi:large subunit ribosomal protein L24|nr:50S ribosomal protein L24 [Flavobacteriales bacterium]HPH80945.1 50S ribosomal protein L24 [Flavobacteriales bacterium]